MEKHERRALSRALTKANRASAAEQIENGLAGGQHAAHRIGITGPPGAGKSTLIASLAASRASAEHQVGILAIDPSSPITGGAILGDRIRMDDSTDSRHVYIRSFASGKLSDGLTGNLAGALDVMDQYGFSEVVVETVGVGQVNHAISVMVDTVVVVLVPESGDTIQAMKAGILEIADIYVVNKSDRPGAERVVADLEGVLAHAKRTPEQWEPRVLLTSAAKGDLGNLGEVINEHRAWTARVSTEPGKARQRSRYLATSLLSQHLNDIAAELPDEAFDGSLKSLKNELISRLK